MASNKKFCPDSTEEVLQPTNTSQLGLNLLFSIYSCSSKISKSRVCISDVVVKQENNSLLPEYHGLSSGQGFPFWGGVNLLSPIYKNSPAIDPHPLNIYHPLPTPPLPPPSTKSQLPPLNNNFLIITQ